MFSSKKSLLRHSAFHKVVEVFLWGIFLVLVKGRRPLLNCASLLNIMAPHLVHALAAALSFTVLFSPNCILSISFCSTWSFSFYTHININNNNIRDSMLCYLDITFAKEISTLLFNFASGNFLGQKKKSSRYFTKISQECPLAQLLMWFSRELLELGLHSQHSSHHCCPPRSYWVGP